MALKDELNPDFGMDYFNEIYNKHGFKGVCEAVEGELKLGKVIHKDENIVCITTGGWSNDERIIESLLHMFSLFGNKHYIGNLRGGAFYFAEHLECANGAFEITEKLPDRDTCNPKICKWCKYSNKGIRDPARSITLCDGCRYNEEFEHIGIKIR